MFSWREHPGGICDFAFVHTVPGGLHLWPGSALCRLNWPQTPGRGWRSLLRVPSAACSGKPPAAFRLLWEPTEGVGVRGGRGDREQGVGKTGMAFSGAGSPRSSALPWSLTVFHFSRAARGPLCLPMAWGLQLKRLKSQARNPNE